MNNNNKVASSSEGEAYNATSSSSKSNKVASLNTSRESEAALLRRANNKIIPNATLANYLQKSKQGREYDLVMRSGGESSDFTASESDRENNDSKSGGGSSSHSHSHSARSKRELLVSVTRDSILSSEVSNNNYRGFLNLAILILVVSHFRLMIENLLKYGLLINTPRHVLDFISHKSVLPSLLLIISINVWIVLSYAVEAIMASHVKSVLSQVADTKKFTGFSTLLDVCVKTAHVIIVSTLFGVPIVLIYEPIYGILSPHPVAGLIIMALMTVTLLKLISYAAINANLRSDLAKALQTSRGTSSTSTTFLQELRKYPYNVTLGNMFYFMWAPTLVYEEVFARSKSIRWPFLFRRVFELLLFLFLMSFMVEQYVLPIVRNAEKAMNTNDAIGILERLMKLTVPNIIVWLMIFYSFFHLTLNITGELLRFGDRLFYLDFWNATSMDYFWRTWNIPTHKWMVAHIYTPLTSRGISPNIASFMVFFVSAIFHELIISIPFQTMEVLAFLAMMAQMPMSFITRKYTKGKQIGNVIFWLSFAFGQANCVLMYYYNFQKNHQQVK